MRPADRILAALACLAGLLGVAASAAAAHIAGADSLKLAAQFLLFHAPAVLGLTALSACGFLSPILARVSAALILAGLCLFCGDLALRVLAGSPLFPMAAPTGGFALMGGWLLGAVAALVPARN
ncbi:hypothetical protein FMGBMHLM_3273 [Methylobacterium aerolatum]|nr:DUF423 domain-containing protein [Methylobacterium aerolatum]GJD36353.1 hypothetical protein FMGBMHLM_3273 [Methylobacterium aerolatum]